MFSEYRGECPKCGDLRATYYRELGSREVNLHCGGCGFKEARLLPWPDEDAQKTVYSAASNAMESRARAVSAHNCRGDASEDMGSSDAGGSL
jgi:hypothetical protein